jgi:type I restriction enzyme S subunit
MAGEGFVQLRDVCVKIGSGATPRGGKEAYKGGDTSLIRSQNVYNEGFHRNGLVYIDDDQSAELRNVEVKQNDVLLNITGDSVARCCQVAADVLPARVNQHVAIIRPEPKALDARFLRYVLVSHEYQSRLLALASAGATRPALTKSMIEELEVPSPPLAEQRAIAAVLGALDDKIELNRRMNATLEAMARALFQSWFVDFDPVRAKMDGRKPAGMDDATAALFPASFREAEIGPIPEGWWARPLPEVIEVNPRRILKAGIVAPYLDMKNLPTQGHSAEEVINREFSSGTKFQNGDTLLARITPCLENGKTGYVDFLKDEQIGWGSTEYIVFAPQLPLPPQFGYLLARSDGLRSHAIQNMTGTSGRQRVPSECFNSFWLAVPPPEIAKRFDGLTAPLMAKIKANADQSRTLANLRDTLLPKLLSGELSVRNANTEKDVAL